MRPAYDMKPVYDEYAAMEYWPLEEAIKLVLDVDPEDDRLLIPHMLPALKKQNDDCGGDSDSLERLVLEKRNDIRADIRGLMGHVNRAKAQAQRAKEGGQKMQQPDLTPAAIDHASLWPVQEDEDGGVNGKQFVRWVESKGVEIPCGLNRAMSARELPAQGQRAGERRKYDTALQDVINHIFRALKGSGKKGTMADMKDLFISKRAMAGADPDGWELSPFETSIPNCDELYIEGENLMWKDRGGNERYKKFRSLEPYFKRAREIYQLTKHI